MIKEGNKKYIKNNFDNNYEEIIFPIKYIKTLVIGLNFMINAQTLRQAILPEDEYLFKYITIRIIQPSSSEIIPAILKLLGNFIVNLEIDLN